MEKRLKDDISQNPYRDFAEINLRNLGEEALMKFNSSSSLLLLKVSKNAVIRSFLIALSEFDLKFDESMQQLLDDKHLDPDELDMMKVHFINQLVEDLCPQVFQELELILDSEVELTVDHMSNKLNLIVERCQKVGKSKKSIKLEIERQQESLIEELTQNYVGQISQLLGIDDQQPWFSILMQGRINILKEILISKAENNCFRMENCLDNISSPLAKDFQMFKKLCVQTFKEQATQIELSQNLTNEQSSSCKTLLQIFIIVNSTLNPSQLKVFQELLSGLPKKMQIHTYNEYHHQQVQIKHYEQSTQLQQLYQQKQSSLIENLKRKIKGQKVENLYCFFKILLQEDASNLSIKRKLMLNMASQFFPVIEANVFVQTLLNCNYEVYASDQLTQIYDLHNEFHNQHYFLEKKYQSLEEIHKCTQLNISRAFLYDMLFRSRLELAKVRSYYELKLMKLNNIEKASHIVICISGFLSQGCDEEKEWSQLVAMSNDCDVQLYNLKWNSLHFQEFLKIIFKSAYNILLFLSQRAVDLFFDQAQAIKKVHKLLSVLKQAKRVFQFFYESRSHAKLAGQMLGYFLASRNFFQYQSISLVGFSLGGQVIKSCLKTMHELQAFNIIHNVTFLGAACQFKNIQRAEQILAQVVYGKVLNYFTPKDLILYLYILSTQAIPLGVWPRIPNNEGHKALVRGKGENIQSPLYLNWKNVDVSEYMDIQAMLRATHFAYKSKLKDLFKEFQF